jgi:hypothetical protein
LRRDQFLEGPDLLQRAAAPAEQGVVDSAWADRVDANFAFQELA